MFPGSRVRTAVEVAHPVALGAMVVITPLLWALFVATKQVHEIMVGGVVSLFTALFTLGVARSSDLRLRLTPRDLAQAWRIPWYIASGATEIVLVLLKDLLGIEPAKNLHRVCGFDASTHDPVKRARSILAIAYTTIAPNFIIIGLDASQSRLLFHQISRSTVPLMTRRLGAKA